MKRSITQIVRRPAVVAVFLLLGLAGSATASPLDTAHMFITASDVPSADYQYPFVPTTPYSATFTSVSRLQVLPAFAANGVDPYRIAMVDYNGDITDGLGTITFNQPGPYVVRATYLDGTSSFIDFGVGFNVNPNQTGPTRTWKPEPVPENATIIVDPNNYVDSNGQTRNLKDSQPDIPASSSYIDTFTTWAEVVAYMKRQTNAHVELSGHGAPGQFYWNGQLVLDGSAASQATLNEWKTHVSSLTFMSCYTGSSLSFLTTVASILGSSGGYTNAVGGDGKTWYVADGGTYVVIPNGPTVLILAGFFCLAVRRDRGRGATID